MMVLVDDPFELRSLDDNPAHAGQMVELRAEPERLSEEVGDMAPPRDPGGRGGERPS